MEEEEDSFESTDADMIDRLPANGDVDSMEQSNGHTLPILLDRSTEDGRYWRTRAKFFENEVSRLEHLLARERRLSTRITQALRATSQFGEQDVRDFVQNLLPETGKPASDDISLQALLKGYTTNEDIRNVTDMCHRLNSLRAHEILESFFSVVVAALDRKSDVLKIRDLKLPPDWYKEPWYCVHPRSISTSSGKNGSHTFGGLERLLPFLSKLGIMNILLYTDYESPMRNLGLDVSDYEPSALLGGRRGFEEFLQAAVTQGFRVVTESILHQTSTEHKWFQAALRGSEQHVDYYVQVNGREKIDESDRNGELVCTYRDPDGLIEHLVCENPEVDRTHGLWVAIRGKTYQFFRSAHPFQVNLNLHNAALLKEIFQIFAEDLSAGVLGKSLYGVNEWFKNPGLHVDNPGDVHALMALLKCLARHLSPRAILIPDVEGPEDVVRSFSGVSTSIRGKECGSEGDLLRAHSVQAALLQMILLENVAPFWRSILDQPDLTGDAEYLNFLEHRGKNTLSHVEPLLRDKVREKLQSAGMQFDQRGFRFAGRIMDCLHGDADRLATAIYCLYVVPGVPAVYVGLELGTVTDRQYAVDAMRARCEIFTSFGLEVDEEACYDLRDLHIAPVPEHKFTLEFSGRNPALELLQKLNSVRRERPSLRSNEVFPVHTGNLAVLSMVRTSSEDAPLLCCVNLSQEEQTCILPDWQLANFIEVSQMCSFRATNLLTERSVYVERRDEGFHLEVKPLARLILTYDSNCQR